MALNDIVFVKGQGGLGRPLEGEDYVSGLLFYGDTPAGFGMSNVKQVFSIAEAEALGINKNYTDNVAAVAEIVFDEFINSDSGTTEIKVSEIDKVVSLGVYTWTAGDTTATLTIAHIAAFINSGTFTHGYTAEADGTSLLITAPKKLGVYVNGQAPTITTTTESSFLVNTNFTGGTQSKNAIWHYHISEYFRLQPKGNLFVGVFSVPMGYNYEEIVFMQDVALGKIRQIGIWKDYYWNSGDTTAVQAQINICDGNHKPLSAIIASDLTDMNIADLTDLNTENNNKVSVVIGQDGGAEGYYLFNTYQHSISCLGAVLGAVSKASVSTDIAWISNFNMSNGVELNKWMLSDGQPSEYCSQGFLNNLDNKRYIFLINYVGIAGTYVNDSHCAVAVSSDYAYIENNRTIDKAIRGVYSSVLLALNSPLQLNADGTLSNTTIAYFTSLAETNLIQMIRDAELSAEQVTIDTNQNVLSTGKLVIAVQLLPIGVARAIQVNIGFVTAIS
jgi:hypothetical protein